jgi:hypothetical protein
MKSKLVRRKGDTQVVKRSAQTDTLCLQETAALAGILSLGRENIPETESFVPSPSHNRTPVSTHRQVQHTTAVAG